MESHRKIYQNKCTGCCLCEIFCSYHHLKLFNNKISSVEICRDVNNSSIKIIFYHKKKGERIPCNFCKGELEPLCSKYCATGAIIYEEV